MIELARLKKAEIDALIKRALKIVINSHLPEIANKSVSGVRKYTRLIPKFEYILATTLFILKNGQEIEISVYKSWPRIVIYLNGNSPKKYRYNVGENLELTQSI